MDDTEDDARYPAKHYSLNHHTSYNSAHRSKLPTRNASFTQVFNDQYEDDDEDDEQEFNDMEEDEEENGVGNNEEDEDEDEDELEHEHEEDQFNYRPAIEDEEEDFDRQPKKRKLKNLVPDYEFPSRAANPPAGGSRAPSSVRNSQADWTDHATFVLLDVWGDRYIQMGKKSLRSDDWNEVAEKVSETTKVEMTDTQCRSRFDTLKNRYKKEKTKLEEMGGGSKWVFYKKMDMLLGSWPRQSSGLACGVDSGEFVFMNPEVYLNYSNGFDEMRDSPANSESGEDDDSDGLPPRRSKLGGEDEGSSFRLLADSVQKFGEIYEKIESSKRQQMMELEKMRMDFHRDLELQKKQILERAHAEIEKIRQGDDEDTDASAENLSG